MVTEWRDAGSWDEPWQPNYLNLISHDGPLVVRCGYNPSAGTFQVVVTHNGFRIAEAEYESAKAALAHCQRYVDERIPSVWEWRLVNDRDSLPRARRVHTRMHEPPGGTRYAP